MLNPCPHCKDTSPGLSFRTNVAGKVIETKCIAHGTFYYNPYYMGYGASTEWQGLLGDEQPIGFSDTCVKCDAILKPPQRKYCPACADAVRLAKNRVRVKTWQKVNKVRHNAKVSAWKKPKRSSLSGS